MNKRNQPFKVKIQDKSSAIFIGYRHAVLGTLEGLSLASLRSHTFTKSHGRIEEIHWMTPDFKDFLTDPLLFTDKEQSSPGRSFLLPTLIT